MLVKFIVGNLVDVYFLAILFRKLIRISGLLL